MTEQEIYDLLWQHLGYVVTSEKRHTAEFFVEFDGKLGILARMIWHKSKERFTSQVKEVK